MKKETGGPAFPQVSYNMKGGYDITGGMSLRDYLAAKAMQAQANGPLRIGDDEAHRLIAERAYRIADAMLKEREK